MLLSMCEALLCIGKYCTLCKNSYEINGIYDICDYKTWFNGYKKFEVGKKSIQKQSSQGKVIQLRRYCYRHFKSQKVKNSQICFV